MMLFQDDQQELIEEKYEINVTPFIDVVLVLLIIFMIAAPLSTVTTDIELPTSGAKGQAPDDMLILSLDRQLKIHVNGEEKALSRSELKQRLDQLTENDASQVIYIQADKSTGYGDLMLMFDDLRRSGYLNVSLLAVEKSAAE